MKYTPEERTQCRAILLAKLGGVCKRCGTNKGLEFDHIDPKSKSWTIARGLSISLNIQVLMEEAKKCQLLCNPCHHDKTREDNGWDAAVHGTANMYRNLNCRCQDCREAWRKYFVPRNRAYRKTQAAKNFK